MIKHNCTYGGAIKRYTPKFSIHQCNVNLSLNRTTEMEVTDEELRIIKAARGLLGKKAKLAVFKVFIDLGHYTYEQLVNMFPTYIP